MNEILFYLASTLLYLYLLAILLRFLLQATRADFYNPLSQFVVRITNPLLQPMRKVIPGFNGIDVSSLILALVVEALGTALLMWLAGYRPPGIGPLLVWGSLGLLALLLNFYFFALLAVIILSWVAPGVNNPVQLLLYQLTEPVMAPFRRLLPPLGGLDLSPILVFMVINVLNIGLEGAARSVSLPFPFVVGF